MLIGNAGSPEIAMVGFHSQAGWIAFTLVAVAFSLATRNLAWVQRPPISDSPAAIAPSLQAYPTPNSRNPPWPPPIWFPSLPSWQRRFSPAPAPGTLSGSTRFAFSPQPSHSGITAPVTACRPLTSASVGERRSSVSASSFFSSPPSFGTRTCLALAEASPGPLGIGLASLQLSPAGRFTWIAFRVAASALTLPLAEELAFRGFFARRLIQRAFDQLSYAQLSVVPVIASSLLYGLMYGKNWLPGILAGLAFALLARSRNRLGDAIAAHATANLLLAAWILARGDFGQW